MTQPLLIAHHDGVDWVTLNRPDSLNALDPALIDALNTITGNMDRAGGNLFIGTSAQGGAGTDGDQQ